MKIFQIPICKKSTTHCWIGRYCFWNMLRLFLQA